MSSSTRPGPDRDRADARTGRARPDERGAGSTAPAGPTGLSARGWLAAVWRTVKQVKVDNLTDWAAALTYYGVLSLFPALLVLVSLIGLAGKDTTQKLIANIEQAAPGSVRQVLVTGVTNLQQGRGTAGMLAIVGLVAALWSASGYIGAFMRAANAIYDVPEGRPIWKTLPIRLGTTAVMMGLLAVTALAVVLTGSFADQVGHWLGIGHAAVTAWDIAKWPVLLIIVSFMFGLLYWAAPNARQGFRWVTPGGMLAVLLWLAASGGFAVYAANFGSYNKTYGALASVIIPRRPTRRRTERRTRTRPGHRRRPPGRPGAVPATPRHQQDQENRGPLGSRLNRPTPRAALAAPSLTSTAPGPAAPKPLGAAARPGGQAYTGVDRPAPGD